MILMMAEMPLRSRRTERWPSLSQNPGEENRERCDRWKGEAMEAERCGRRTANDAAAGGAGVFQ